jgi:predicted dehydrogenase
LIQSTHVDAVYIPLPVVVKKSWVIKTLISGKHVVIEKPVAMRAADYNEILNAARIHHKFLLDGTMFPHHPRTSKIIDSLCELGQVDRIEANFTFLADQEFLDGSNIRARKDGDPHGCLGDLGWYCIRYALMIFGKLGANVKSAQVVDFEVNKHGVPIDAVCVVRFENVSDFLKNCLW